MDSETKAKSDLALIEEHLGRVVTAAALAIRRIKISEGDHFGFVALNFLSRQLEHSQSVRKLIPYRDAALVARTMVEGLCQLSWAAGSPDERGLQWRAYAWIRDWRKVQASRLDGVAVDGSREEQIADALKLYGSMFEKKGAAGKPDPYHTSWRAGVTIRDMCVEAESLALYEDLYAGLSDWEHWGPEGIGYAIRREEADVRYEPVSYTVAAQALSVAFKCVAKTFELVDAHLKLGRDVEIGEMVRSYLKALRPDLVFDADPVK